jgi:hypothetical protein
VQGVDAPLVVGRITVLNRRSEALIFLDVDVMYYHPVPAKHVYVVLQLRLEVSEGACNVFE